MTAVGTVGATFVALVAAGVAIGVARWSDRQTAIRLEQQRVAADARLAEEQDRADKRLEEERASADARLREELEHSAAQLREERLAVQGREQLVEAYQVQVTPLRLDAGTEGKQPDRDPGEPVERAGVLVINHGHYTIIGIQAKLCTGGNGLIGYASVDHRSAFYHLPPELRGEGVHEGRPVKLTTLCPMDLGMRYTSDVIASKFLVDSYPIIRWQDRWDTWWEHKKGVVRGIDENESWTP
jgi:hypothetical protein